MPDTTVDPKAVIGHLTQQIGQLAYELALARAANDALAKQLATKTKES